MFSSFFSTQGFPRDLRRFSTIDSSSAVDTGLFEWGVVKGDASNAGRYVPLVKPTLGGETYLFTIGGCVLSQLDFWNLSHVVATKTWSELVSKSRSRLNLSPHRFLVAESNVSSLGSVWRWEMHVRGFTASSGSIQAYNIIAGNQPCMFHCISV